MTNINEVIKLRAHHLLCLQGYQGYGYDENFKINLENVLKHLKTNPNVIVVEAADNLCNHCPKLKNGKCHLHLKDEDKPLSQEENNRSDKEIIKMDSNTLKKIGIDENKEYNVKDLYKIINNSIKKKKDLEDICGECIWIKECLWYQSKDDD
jgi:hypothetical protein